MRARLLSMAAIRSILSLPRRPNLSSLRLLPRIPHSPYNRPDPHGSLPRRWILRCVEALYASHSPGPHSHRRRAWRGPEHLINHKFTRLDALTLFYSLGAVYSFGHGHEVRWSDYELGEDLRDLVTLPSLKHVKLHSDRSLAIYLPFDRCSDLKALVLDSILTHPNAFFNPAARRDVPRPRIEYLKLWSFNTSNWLVNGPAPSISAASAASTCGKSLLPNGSSSSLSARHSNISHLIVSST
jgi:hypothetical protein